jgi:hypothetical protein
LHKRYAPKGTATFSLLPTTDAVAPFRLRIPSRDRLPFSSLHLRNPPQKSPWLRFLSRAASRAKNSWTRCGAFWGGPRRRTPGRSGPARFPSATLPRGSSSFSIRTLCAGWFLRSPPSSFCSWRSLASNFIISPPTPFSSRRSSPTSWRCSWGCAPAPPSSNISTPWLGPGRSAARLALITSSSGTGWRAPTSPLSPAPSGRTGAKAGSLR